MEKKKYRKSPKLQEFEKSLIKEAISKNPFITKDALAKELGCSARNVYRLLNTYNVIKRPLRLNKEQK